MRYRYRIYPSSQKEFHYINCITEDVRLLHDLVFHSLIVVGFSKLNNMFNFLDKEA